MSDVTNGAASRAESAAHGEHARAHTRQRIQAVALELFAEQGYDKTSLREIAERLEVTKAALYYHFKSKEDIVASLVEDFSRQIDELISWGATLPGTPESRAAVLSRYYGIVADSSPVFRMLQHNQASVSSLANAKTRERLHREHVYALVALLTEPDAPLQDQLRAAVSLASVSFGCMFYADKAGSPDELREAVLEVAFELTDAKAASGSPAG
ncbi:MAG TPA: TetR/AcrR family transcriptional regulator [Streptosporangiaceae bacterium]